MPLSACCSTYLYPCLLSSHSHSQAINQPKLWLKLSLHTHICIYICLNEYHNRLYCSTSITGISERKVRILEKMTTATMWMQLKQMLHLNCSFCIYSVVREELFDPLYYILSNPIIIFI